MKNINTLLLLTTIVFSGLASAATFEVRYPIPATTNFAAPLVPPVVPPVVPPTEPTKPEEPKFDLSPWQNVAINSSRTVVGNPNYWTFDAHYAKEINSKNSDIQGISLGVNNNNTYEFTMMLIDPTQKRDWTEFKKNAKTLSIKFNNNPLTITCQISSFGNSAMAMGPGITAGCAKINTIINYADHTNSEGKLDMTLNIY